jgi:hypothetical protein
MKTDPDHDPTVMPSADDPSETLEESIDRLAENVDRHVARMDHIRTVLSTAYLAEHSMSSLAPVWALAEELNPALKARRTPATIVRRHLVCDRCNLHTQFDARLADEWTPPLCPGQHLPHPMYVASIELLPSPAVDALTPSQIPF